MSNPQRRLKAKMNRIAELKRSLPYGVWTCADGRQVLFNRGYKPLLQRKGGVVLKADQEEWVSFVDQKWFYTDANPPWHSNHGPSKNSRLSPCSL